MFYILGAGAIIFTVAAYALKIKQLSLFAAILWGTLGGYCLSQSAATWDIYYVLGFVGFIAMIGEGWQAWGMLTKKEETEDDAELDFEGQLAEAHNNRKAAQITRKEEASTKRENMEQKAEERAAKRFGIR